MTVELTRHQIQNLLQGIAIPPQPQVMVDLQMEQCSPSCSVERIAELICQDVGLSGSILKTVNSPFLRSNKTITSITQAVSLLGADSVINLVNALSIKGTLSDDDIIALGSFWDSALEVAMASAVIAKEIGLQNPDEAYTLGLFHNCGVPLLMARFDNYRQVCQESYANPGTSITEIENTHLKTNHAVVGYFVAKSWNLPPYLCQAIHEHHNVDKVFAREKTENRKKYLLAILKMAEHICALYQQLGGQSTDYEWEQIGETILIYAGLSQYDFENISSQVNELGFGEADYH